MIGTIAIVGVGLIGGSFARAVRQAGFTGRVLGVSSPESAAKALQAGVVDEAVSLEEACARADLLYLAHRISRILELIPLIGQSWRPGLLVTDAGSTKSQICATAAQHLPLGSFLGGHPMAGKETRGIEGADPLLFRNRTYVVTPTSGTQLNQNLHQEFLIWLRLIGAQTIIMSPEEHDRTVALTSHLPQIASTVIAQTVLRNLPDTESVRAAGPGLHDMTRLALSSFEIWKDILETNRPAIEGAITEYIRLLGEIRSMSTGTIEDAFFEGNRLAARIRRVSDSEIPSKDTLVPPMVPPKETP